MFWGRTFSSEDKTCKAVKYRYKEEREREYIRYKSFSVETFILLNGNKAGTLYTKTKVECETAKGKVG